MRGKFSSVFYPSYYSLSVFHPAYPSFPTESGVTRIHPINGMPPRRPSVVVVVVGVCGVKFYPTHADVFVFTDDWTRVRACVDQSQSVSARRNPPAFLSEILWVRIRLLEV